MADRKIISNDTYAAPQGQGIAYQEEIVTFALNEASAHGTGAVTLQGIFGPVNKNGRIVDFIIGVANIAVSASGFVSANVSADLLINSATCLSTQPLIPGPVGSAGAAVRRATNLTFTSAAGNPSPTSAVVNTASANFSAGDMIAINYTCQSAGSAAAGTSGKGFYAAAVVRYAAV